MTIHSILAWVLIFSSTAWAADPFDSVEVRHLENGLTVFLAPSPEASLTEISLEVGVGTQVETAQNWGVSHLLEHVLFRDKQLKDEMSYLQLIQEAGGEANGMTQFRETSYFGSIPAKKGTWLLQQFSKMVLHPDINDEYVQKEKATVELERGKPSPLVEALGFNPKDILVPRYLSAEGFWKTEFGFDFDENFTLTQEQMSTRRLNLATVKEHYQAYYYPSNMRLYVAGKFNRDEILAEINSTWATLPRRDGKSVPLLDAAKPRMKPYYETHVTEEVPYVYLGSKLVDLNLADAQIIDSYVEYLAHRLMKEVRNKKGQTYTASGHTSTWHKNGYAYVAMQSPGEHLSENLKLVREMIRTEAFEGGLTPEQVKEATGLYMAQFELMGRESKSALAIAQRVWNLTEEFGKFESPYRILSDVTPDQFNATLKKHFRPELKYELIYQQPLFFHMDYLLMSFLAAVAGLFAFRRWLTKSFNHKGLRWVRKVKYPPLKTLEFVAGIFAWYLYEHWAYVFSLAFDQVEFLQSQILYTNYAQTLFSVLLAVGIGQGVYSFLPTKLMVVDNDLFMKSISYYSRRFSLDDIAAVETCRCVSYPFPAKRWFGAVRWRFFFFNSQFWREGLLITMKDGRAYYFSMRDAQEVAEELRGFLPQVKDPRSSTSAA